MWPWRPWKKTVRAKWPWCPKMTKFPPTWHIWLWLWLNICSHLNLKLKYRDIYHISIFSLNISGYDYWSTSPSPSSTVRMQTSIWRLRAHRGGDAGVQEIQSKRWRLGWSNSRGPGAPVLNTWRPRQQWQSSDHPTSLWAGETTAAEESNKAAWQWITLRLWWRDDQRSNNGQPT